MSLLKGYSMQIIWGILFQNFTGRPAGSAKLSDMWLCRPSGDTIVTSSLDNKIIHTLFTVVSLMFNLY